MAASSWLALPVPGALRGVPVRGASRSFSVAAELHSSSAADAAARAVVNIRGLASPAALIAASSFAPVSSLGGLLSTLHVNLHCECAVGIHRM